MSEFSDKLSEYIVKSGSNVYQLAKEASLDRTTLQKTAKGQRSEKPHHDAVIPKEVMSWFHPSVRLPPLPEGENADIAGAISVPSVPSSGTS